MRSSSQSTLPSAADIDREAAKWFAWLDREAVGARIDLDAYAAAQPAFAEWLALSPGNRVALLRLISTWQRASRLSALKSPGAEPPAHRAWRPTWGWAAVGLAAALVIAVSLNFMRPIPAGSASGAYATEIGGHQSAVLTDGTTIELNSDTRLNYTISNRERIVELQRGEAFFVVAHESNRPFRVIAGDREVTVMGTKFSVHRRDNGIEVAVSEGRVRLAGPDRTTSATPTVLGAGDIAMSEGSALLIQKTNPEKVTQALSWRQGMIVFDNTTLGEAAAEFNRYSRIELRIIDPKVAAIRISGSFRSDNLDAFVRLLGQGFNVQVERSGNQILISE